MAVTLTTDLELDAAMVATSGAPPGHAAPVAVVPLDDRGDAVGVATYPVVADGADGSYRWTTTLRAGARGRVGCARRRRACRTRRAGRRPRRHRPAAATGDVSLATVDDADTGPGAPGAVGDVVLSHRRGAGRWSSREVVVGGPGRQAVDAVVATGELAVGVGEQVTTDPAGTTVVAPLVVVTNGTTTRTIPLDGQAQTLTAACPGPAGTVVAIGTDAAGATVVTTIDVDADVVTTVPAPPGISDHRVRGPRRRVAARRGAVAVRVSRRRRRSSRVAALAPGERIVAIGAGPAGFAVTGSHGRRATASSSPATDVRQLARVEVPALGGVGEQVPTGVIVGATTASSCSGWPTAPRRRGRSTINGTDVEHGASNRHEAPAPRAASVARRCGD